MNRQQKETLKEVVLLLAMLLFIMFGVTCVLSENEYLLEQDRIRAEKREIWLEQQNQLNGEQR